jgi:hypothetical protein
MVLQEASALDPRHEEPPIGDAPWHFLLDTASGFWGDPLDDPDRDANHDFANIVLILIVGSFLLIVAALISAAAVYARDLDGQWAASPLAPWFNQLASSKGLCCSFADGRRVDDPDWGTQSVDGKDAYWVILDNRKLIVPQSAIVTVPNRFGAAVVWPVTDENGIVKIRCFMPGAER